MPISLTYKMINDGQFMSAIGKLTKFDNWGDQRVAYNAAKFIRRFKQEMEMAQELFVKMVKKHAKCDEKGNLIAPEGKDGQFEIPEENISAWNKAKEEFESVSFDIDCHKFPVEKLEGVGLSALDLNAIEAMLIPMDLGDKL